MGDKLENNGTATLQEECSSLLFHPPVRMNDDQTIVDAKNRVIVPMCWKNDLDHVRKQERIGNLIVDLLNKHADAQQWAQIIESNKKATNGQKKAKR